MKIVEKSVMVHILLGLLLFLLTALQIRLWVSEDGFAEVSRLRSQISFQGQENARLTERNQRLEADVQDLKRGFTALEERARSDLGLISPDESFYVFGDSAEGESVAKDHR
jgi:cell division protein FtsB